MLSNEAAGEFGGSLKDKLKISYLFHMKYKTHRTRLNRVRCVFIVWPRYAML